MTNATPRMTIDVRKIAPQDRFRLILPVVSRLSADESIELVNDVDPQLLLRELQGGAAGPIAWDYLESGPQTWRVRLAGPPSGHSHGQCCGNCGGT